jgi:hypothetical protein
VSEIKIVTAADSEYFYALMTLLTTLFHSGGLSELEVDVWDLGLSERQVRILSCVDFVKLRYFDGSLEPFPGAFGIQQDSFAWKPFAIESSMPLEKGLLWLDAGVAVSSNIMSYIRSYNSPIFIQNNDHLNRDWNSRQCQDLMKLNEQELNSFQLHGNILYFDSRDKQSLAILREWVYWTSKESVSFSLDPVHRHDQSVLSILANRYRIPLISQDRVVQENELYQMAYDANITFLAHRRRFSWIDLDSIISLNRKDELI